MQTETVSTTMDVLGMYVGTLRKKSDRGIAKQELIKFVQWCGSERPISDIKPFEISQYSEQVLSVGNASDVSERKQELRKFLLYAKNKDLISQNLATYFRTPKSRSKGSKNVSRNVIELTSDGYKKMEKELSKLRSMREPLALQIKKAAADKDVRENAPLEAAREELGFVEGRIFDIESKLKLAVIMNLKKRKPSATVRLGSQVKLKDLSTGKSTLFTVVSQFEANSMEGKISDISPVGSALVNCVAGQEINVNTPRGNAFYRVMKVMS